MFKRKYTIIEYKNQRGEKYFCAKYSNWLIDLLRLIDAPFYVWIDSYGTLTCSDYSIKSSSLESCQNLIQKHKDKLKEEAETKFNKSSIHYV